MKLKFISVILAALIFTYSANAQKSSVFVKAGINLANVSITDDGQIDEARMLPSVHIGLQGEIPIVSFLSLQTGIVFTGKGSKTQAGNTADPNYYRAATNPFYVEVPTNVVLKAPLKGGKFFVGTGAYGAMGIAGRNKAEGKLLGVGFKGEDNIDFSNDDPSTEGEEGGGFAIMRRFDYGLNGTIGFEGKSALFSVNYGLGLAKLQSSTSSSADEKNKHRVLSVTIGFRL